MQIGIDLGTTFSCVAYIDENGVPSVIPNSEGEATTASVVWFDGRSAFVGKKANDRKITPTSPIYEFVKRDMGAAVETHGRYVVGGYNFEATGFSSILLRKLKKDAILYFKKKGLLPQEAEEKSTQIPAIITVPAYFGDLQRQETRKAGLAAGLAVQAIINEPTAAALTYSRRFQQNKKIMVFDLGGGTLDISIVDIRNGEGEVAATNRSTTDGGKSQPRASKGFNELGGKDWDELIVAYLYAAFREKTGSDIPDDMGFEVQQKALEAKFELTEQEETTVYIPYEGNDIAINLYRSNPNADELSFDIDLEDTRFYFEERASGLLGLCATLCSSVLDDARLSWSEIDEVVMVGGSCRMPMIPQLLEKLSGQKIQRQVPGFSYDTAIALGAAIYGAGKSQVKDISSKAIGIEVLDQGNPRIEYLVNKNQELPAMAERHMEADPQAVLKVYESESEQYKQVEEAVLRGRLKLENPGGKVSIRISVNEDGLIESVVAYPPEVRKELTIQSGSGIDLQELKQKIMAIDIRT